ncbi:MAG: hypothetical protein WC277_03455, partial [Bacilli bacterium]
VIKLKKINKILIKLIYISLFFLLLGFSYAFFTANITGNNTTTLTMYYNLNLVVESNTFSYGSLKYKLTSTNTGSNGKWFSIKSLYCYR